MGREVKTAASRLRILRDVVIGVYGPANRAAFSFVKAMEAIEHLQQDLASQAAWDLPGFPSNDLYFDQVGQPRPPGMPAGPPPAPASYSSAPPLLRSKKAAEAAATAAEKPALDSSAPEQAS